MTFDPRYALFVPGDRPDRFEKALRSGASAVILDLEDAVAPGRKGNARDAVAAFLTAAVAVERVAVRVNAAGTPWHDDDLAMLKERSVGAVVVPKADDPTALARLIESVGARPIVALIESSRGLISCETIASAPCVVALAFGPYDLAVELGGGDDWSSMLPHRARVLVAARANGLLAIDGPSLAVRAEDVVRADALASAAFGYDGKLLVHPVQVEIVQEAFRPSDDAIAQARRVIDATAQELPRRSRR